MDFSVSLLHVDIQVLVNVGLEDVVKPFGQVKPKRVVFIAGLAVVAYSNHPPAYASQEQIQP